MEGPVREDFRSQEEFEEAKGFWIHRVGRNKKLRGIKKENLKDSLETSSDSPRNVTKKYRL